MRHTWTGWSIWMVLGLALLSGPASSREAGDPLAEEGAQLVEQLNRDIIQIRHLRAEVEQSQGEDLRIASKRLRDRELEGLAVLDELVANISAREEAGGQAQQERGVAEPILSSARDNIGKLLNSSTAELGALRDAREGAAPGELADYEWRIDRAEGDIDVYLEALCDMTEWTEKLGMDAVEIREFMSRQLTLRGEKLSARITLAIEDAGMLRDRLATSPDDADLKQRLAAAAMRKGQADAHLDLTVEMMSRLDMDPSRYQALLLETTGQLSPAVLSVDAVQSLARTWYKRLRTWVVDRGPGLFSSVIILIAVLLLFRLVARLLRKLIERSLDTSKVEISKLAREMLLKVVYNGVMAIGLLVGLSQMGISLGPLLAGLGVAGFIVGFALQDTLGNFASGMMILIYRPFDVGDLVEAAGIMGKVKGMSLVSTTILTLDHQTIIVPNNRIWGDVIKNVTAQEIRRVDMLFGISYTDDIPLAEKVLTEILSGHELVLDDPESQVKLHELGDSSVNFVVRPWTKTDDYWDVYWDVTREVKLRFDREGISIPFPQRDVHLYRADAESAG